MAHAGEYDFGTVTEIIRAATEIAFWDDDTAVTDEHFQKAYAHFSGCLPLDSIFAVAHWDEISPRMTKLREADRRWQKENPATQGCSPTSLALIYELDFSPSSRFSKQTRISRHRLQ